MDDELEQEALFYIEGPDEDGCVWIYGANTGDSWAQNLGPCDKVAEVFSRWLSEIDAAVADSRTRSRRARMEAWDADVSRLDRAEKVRKGSIDIDEVDKG